MPQALIIDDEFTARNDLRTKLGAHPDVTIVAEAATLRAGRELLANAHYDIVFLDIQLIGGTSFDLVPGVRAGARIIFVTAYDNFALRAIEVNALDYLLKPVVPARLAESLQRLSMYSLGDPDESGPPATVLQGSDMVYLRSGPKARFAPVADISVITADDNYSKVQLADGSSVFVRKSLKAWEDTLPTQQFMRVHRTQIANLFRVTGLDRKGDEQTFLHIEGVADPILVSRYRWTELRERLNAKPLE
jgi:two-component system, LytTR family, response regulator